MSTRLKDRADATLNHFDGILIEPIEEQRRKIAPSIKESEEAVEANKRAIKRPRLVDEDKEDSFADRRADTCYCFNNITS